MISYKPLRDHMYRNKILITDLVAAGFNSRTTAKLAKDEMVSLRTIMDLCQFLNLPIEQVVEVIIED